MTELFHFQTGTSRTTRTALFSIANSGQMWWKLLKKVTPYLDLYQPLPASSGGC
jgi:hypothetical protein